MDHSQFDAERATSEKRKAFESAFNTIKQHPRYPSAQLRLIEGLEEIENTAMPGLPKLGLPSPERLDYAIREADIIASSYLELVTDRAFQEAYIVLLEALERSAWIRYRGIAEIEPFGVGPALREIKQRLSHWYKESLRRLIAGVAAAPSSAPARIGYRSHLKSWMKAKKLTSVRVAAKHLAISESTLKSIMSDKGDIRYGPDVLARILKDTGYKSSE
jgi:hypothetical protein